MAVDLHANIPHSRTLSPEASFSITPSDGADLTFAIRQITIGTAGGTISWVNQAGVTQTTGPLPVGSYVMNAHRIRATGTTATGLTGWI
jgi:hypothetical protein